MSNAEICKQKLGFSSPAEVARAINERVKHEAREQSDEDRDTILSVMMDQLDALIHSYWDLATGGSIKDAEFVLKTIAQKAKLAQVDMPDARAVGQTVLVVAGDTEEEYVKSLRGGQPPENGS